MCGVCELWNLIRYIQNLHCSRAADYSWPAATRGQWHRDWLLQRSWNMWHVEYHLRYVLFYDYNRLNSAGVPWCSWMLVLSSVHKPFTSGAISRLLFISRMTAQAHTLVLTYTHTCAHACTQMLTVHKYNIQGNVLISKLSEDVGYLIQNVTRNISQGVPVTTQTPTLCYWYRLTQIKPDKHLINTWYSAY